MTTCAYCGGAVADLGSHYAHNPPAGCPRVAWALDPHWPRATSEPRAAGEGRPCRVCGDLAVPSQSYCRAHWNERNRAKRDNSRVTNFMRGLVVKSV